MAKTAEKKKAPAKKVATAKSGKGTAKKKVTATKTAKTAKATAIAKRPQKSAAKPKAPAKKTVAKKTVTKKAAVKKVAAKKAPATKAVAKKAPVKKVAAVKKPAAKKVTKKTPFKRQIKTMLLKSKSAILQEVVGKRPGEKGPLNVDVGDIYDVASNERDRELSLILGDREMLKLTEIDDALERLQDKSYGLCDECGEPIAEGRLLAMPFTKVCVECKSRSERLNVFARRLEDEGAVNVADRLDRRGDEES